MNSKISSDHTEDTMRLSKRMAQLGLCSRREADSYIEQGWVTVNGKTAVLGQKVSPADRIELNKKAHEQQAARITILLNKPVGYVSAQAEKGYKSAAELITSENHWEGDTSRIRFDPKHKIGLAPAGRLDIDSVGLLVLTQDGRIAKQLIGENSGSEKEYLVKLRPAKVEWQNEDQLRFVLKQGKKRQIRRMCELVGLRVVGLKRIRMGKVKLGRLPPGKWRYLAPDESF